MIPLGLLRAIGQLAALGDIDPAVAICMATGNTSRCHGLDFGFVREGLAADVVILDAPRGSQAGDALEALSIGDTPAVAVVVIDGQVRVNRSRNTPPPARDVKVPWLAASGH
jgi:enamidase